MPRKLSIPLLILLVLLSGCVLYKAEIQQGNVINAEMLDNLKLGMTKRQVVFLLGTPLINDPFHAQRWDYFYSLSKGDGKPERRLLTVYFKDDAVVSVEGDLAPERLKKPASGDPS